MPFNRRDRHRWSQNGLGHRPVNNWGDGDLPAPWAEGDIVAIPDGAYCLTGDTEPGDDGRVDGPRVDLGPGFYTVVYVCSIDHGDAWYVRVSKGTMVGGFRDCSDRLHIFYPDRSTWQGEPVDWTAGWELIDTADPEGLAERERMLAAGWSFEDRWDTCPTCGHTTRKNVDG